MVSKKKSTGGKKTPRKTRKGGSGQAPKKLLIEIEVDPSRLAPPLYKGTPPLYRGSFKVSKVIKIRRK
jgi:hypothetical protein